VIARALLGSNNKLPDEYRLKINEYEDQTLHNYTQQNTDYTQQINNVEKLNSASISQNMNETLCGCGLDWSRIEAFQASNPGSNPGSRTTHHVAFLERRLN
jgi:hypothetical protein